MKSLMGVSFALIVGLPPGAEAGPGRGGVEKCTAKNGDVNADGTIDLADAVTVLGRLFLGDPTELVPLCAEPAKASGLADTGQTICYDVQGNLVPCDGATCPGQDGAYLSGDSCDGRFTDNGDNTVTDHATGLVWQQDTGDVNGDGQVPDDESDALGWCDALEYCENLSLAGHEDWRLPNVRELESIVDLGRFFPAIDPVFGALPSASYWSSTSLTFAHGLAYKVFIGGAVYGLIDKFRPGHVRAVRGDP